MTHTPISTEQGDAVAIFDAARSNGAFRRVIRTGEHEQVVVMTIPPGGDIGEEVHPATDQVFLFVDQHIGALFAAESADPACDERIRR